MVKNSPKSKRGKNEEKRMSKVKPKKKSKKTISKKLSKITYGQQKYVNPYEYFIYARVSKKEAEEAKSAAGSSSGKETSIKAQKDTMLSVAHQKWIIIRPENIITENESWKKGTNREKFNEMVKKLEKDAEIHSKNMEKRKYGGVLFWKLDRLARNFQDFAKLDLLMDKGYEFISATETIENTYTGRLLFRILAGFAIYESEKLSARVGFSYVKNLMANDFKRLWGNRIIFWYEFTKTKDKIVQHTERAKIVKEIYECYAEQKELIKDWHLFWKSAFDLTLEEIESKHSWKLQKYIKAKKKITTPRNLIENILKNDRDMKYNWYIDFELDVKDEIVTNLFKEVKEKYKEYENIILKGTGQVGTKILFRFFFPELEIIESEKYKFVQDSINREWESKKTMIPIKDDRKDEALFSSLIYFQNKYSIREWNVYFKPKKKTWHYRTEAGLELDEEGKMINEEMSEWRIEEFLWQNNELFKNISNLSQSKRQKELIKFLQLRQNMYEIWNMTKSIGQVRVYEMQLQTLKIKRDATMITDLNELKKVYARIEYTEDLLEIAKKNLRKIEEVRTKLVNNFEEIIKPGLYATKDKDWKWTTRIAKDEKTRILRGLGYRFMMEKIIINKSKSTMEVHFYPEIQRILWLPSPIATIHLPKG